MTAALADTRVEVLPVTREIALTGAAHAGVLPDPADQLIYATALEHGATLVSRDGALRDLDARRVVSSMLVTRCLLRAGPATISIIGCAGPEAPRGLRQASGQRGLGVPLSTLRLVERVDGDVARRAGP